MTVKEQDLFRFPQSDTIHFGDPVLDEVTAFNREFAQRYTPRLREAIRSSAEELRQRGGVTQRDLDAITRLQDAVTHH